MSGGRVAGVVAARLISHSRAEYSRLLFTV